MKANYYIYIHINLTTSEIFYVGKGTAYRASCKNHRSKWWNSIVSKYGYDIVLIEEGLTEEKAFELEKYYIKHFGRKDLGLGSLVNMTDGGEGMSGAVGWNRGLTTCEETKKKMSLKRKGVLKTEATKQKMSQAKKNRPWSEARRQAYINKKSTYL